MTKWRSGWWVGGLLTLLLGSFTACNGDDDPAPQGDGGESSMAGSGGKHPTAGTKHGGEGGGGEGGGVGGEGGTAVGGEGGTSSERVGDYRVMASFDTDADDLVAWPELGRVAVVDRGRAVVEVFEVDDGGVALTESFEAGQLLEGAQGISGLAKYGDDFVAVVTNGEAPVQQQVVKVELGEAPEVLVALPETEQAIAVIADPELGVVVSTPKGVKLAETGSATWKTLAEGRGHVPLALEGNRILIGVEERSRLGDGAGGSGGEGGTGGDAARLIWMDLDGNPLEEHEAYGNPQVAVKDEAGWLIGETNSFWGSYRAGIELLSESGLELLTKVPVISSGDGTDGAYDLLHEQDRLLVANCESGLLQADFSTAELELQKLEGPWESESCSPRALEAVGSTIVVGGLPLLFLRRDE